MNDAVELVSGAFQLVSLILRATKNDPVKIERMRSALEEELRVKGNVDALLHKWGIK